jgi:hypothetical protein
VQDGDARHPVEDLAERWKHHTIELDREDLGPRARERDGERAEPGANLDDRYTRRGARIGGDRAREVRIGEEVLPEALRRPDAVACGQRADLGQPEETWGSRRRPTT